MSREGVEQSQALRLLKVGGKKEQTLLVKKKKKKTQHVTKIITFFLFTTIKLSDHGDVDFDPV